MVNESPDGHRVLEILSNKPSSKHNTRGYVAGRFSRIEDTRGSRCVNPDCRKVGWSNCIHCKYLPHVSSGLRHQSSIQVKPRVMVRSHSMHESIESKLSHLLEDLRDCKRVNLQVTDSFGTTFRAWAPFATSPLEKARVQLTRIRGKIVAEEQNNTIPEDRVSHFTRIDLKSKRPTSSAGCS